MSILSDKETKPLMSERKRIFADPKEVRLVRDSSPIDLLRLEKPSVFWEKILVN